MLIIRRASRLQKGKVDAGELKALEAHNDQPDSAAFSTANCQCDTGSEVDAFNDATGTAIQIAKAIAAHSQRQSEGRRLPTTAEFKEFYDEMTLVFRAEGRFQEKLERFEEVAREASAKS